MSSVFDNLSGIAVWGSLSASLLLGANMTVQACIEKARRYRYFIFALNCFAVAVLDFVFPRIGYLTYEALRVVLWGANAAAILWLFHLPGPLALLVLLGLPSAGFAVWTLVAPEVATSVVVPASFLIASLAHAHQYRKNRGYSSCLLAAYSLLIALMCTLYLQVLATNDPRIIGLGYLHYAGISLLAVLFGWVNLPREIRGKAPVKVDPRHARLFALSLLAAEAGVQYSLIVDFTWPPSMYLGFTLFQVLATLGLYFHHRHQLVIYTDNVVELLDKRTESLRLAREELAKQNEIQAERLREQATELVSKSAVIERQRRLELAAQTAGQAAHDIQNLISPMLVHIRELENAETGGDVRESVAIVRRQIDELLDLNSQMLALSRRGRLDYEILALEEVAEELVHRFPAGALEISVERALWISGSWSQLLRAVSNLVSNALESSAVAPRVSIRAGRAELDEMRRCHLGFLNPGSYSFIEISDNGPGIPQDHLERIFEPFFSSKPARGSSGSGLGLTIVSAVLEDHRGVLDLVTGPSGSTFTLYFPSREAPERSGAEDLCPNVTVAVIDRDSEGAARIAQILRSAGCNAEIMESGFEFLRALQSRRIDLAVLGDGLEGQSPYDIVFAAMHIRPETRAIVHAKSLPSSESNRLRAIGVRVFLEKPCAKRDLISAVRSLVDDKSSQPAEARAGLAR